MIPLHCACEIGNIGTALYLAQIHPESINMTDDNERNCLHILLTYRSADRFFDFVEFSAGVIKFFGFLLSKAPELIFSTTRNGDLPLHLVCKGGHILSVTEFVYNTYPEAIYRRNNAGNTPLYEAQASYMYDFGEQDSVILFLECQLSRVNEAENYRTPDIRGRLHIHRAMFNVNLPVGTLKLMIRVNPDSALIADGLGQTPLHIACQHCNMDVIKYLVDAHQHTLLIPDSSGDLPLHIACRYGRFDVIELILDRAAGGGVSVENDNGKLPIEMLLYEATCDRNSLEYVQAVYALLRAHPESVTGLHA
jgi:ankyrin